MTAGIKANVDGSGAIQVGGSDYITISSAGAVTIPQTLAVTGATTLPIIKSATSATPPTVQDSAGTQIGTFCRAWVNFNGTLVTNPASMTGVRGSFNVSSILDSATGTYVINFTNAMPDVNYCAVLGWEYRGANQNSGGFTVATMLTGSCGVFFASSASAYDPPVVSVAIFR